MGGHSPPHLSDVVICTHGDGLTAAEFPGGDLAGVAVLGQRFHDDVAVGEHALESSVLTADRQGADPEVGHLRAAAVKVSFTPTQLTSAVMISRALGMVVLRSRCKRSTTHFARVQLSIRNDRAAVPPAHNSAAGSRRWNPTEVVGLRAADGSSEEVQPLLGAGRWPDRLVSFCGSSLLRRSRHGCAFTVTPPSRGTGRRMSEHEDCTSPGTAPDGGPLSGSRDEEAEHIRQVLRDAGHDECSNEVPGFVVADALAATTLSGPFLVTSTTDPETADDLGRFSASLRRAGFHATPLEQNSRVLQVWREPSSPADTQPEHLADE